MTGGATDFEENLLTRLRVGSCEQSGIDRGALVVLMNVANWSMSLSTSSGSVVVLQTAVESVGLSRLVKPCSFR